MPFRDVLGRTGKVHTVTLPLRWSDFDIYGHVNNAAYLEFSQDSRVAFLQEMGSIAGTNSMPQLFVRHAELDYRRGIAPSSNTVTVNSEVTRIGRTSFGIRQLVLDSEGIVCCEIKTTLVAVDVRSSSPRIITDSERQLLESIITCPVQEIESRQDHDTDIDQLAPSETSE
ncbi:acyl-CoA thioesterase [Corynebacterium kroppenstedtii]|uniref:acyl-CoA thioesterase n=1 Tax=Corynebacterium sp. PCR 32 TaxID=3351342 RepID=UPI00309F67D9